MTVAAPAVISGVDSGLTVIAKAIRALYGMADAIDEFLDKHIEELKNSAEPTIARTGRVLEAAKFGFGIGYITSVVVIATGQLLLGNTWLALGTVATGVTLTNPIAMTCAAVGAVYYGWRALSERERNEILETLTRGLAVGIELIKATIHFVIEKTKELLSPQNIEEFKKYIKSTAAMFGKTLGDVTHKVGDVVGDAVDVVKKKTGDAVEKTVAVTSEAYGAVAEGAERAVAIVRERVDSFSGIHKTFPEDAARRLQESKDAAANGSAPAKPDTGSRDPVGRGTKSGKKKV